MNDALDLPYPPSLNRLYRNVVIAGRARTLLTKEARAYKQRVADICLAERVRPIKGDVQVCIVAYRPRRRGDLDNLLKIVTDSLQGFLYENDSQIALILAIRKEDKQYPRLEVKVCPYEPMTLSPDNS